MYTTTSWQGSAKRKGEQVDSSLWCGFRFLSYWLTLCIRFLYFPSPEREWAENEKTSQKRKWVQTHQGSLDIKSCKQGVPRCCSRLNFWLSHQNASSSRINIEFCTTRSSSILHHTRKESLILVEKEDEHPSKQKTECTSSRYMDVLLPSVLLQNEQTNRQKSSTKLQLTNKTFGKHIAGPFPL